MKKKIALLLYNISWWLWHPTADDLRQKLEESPQFPRITEQDEWFYKKGSEDMSRELNCKVCGREGGHMGGVTKEEPAYIGGVNLTTTNDNEISSRLAVTDKNIDQLRQWLNEERIDDFKKMITNDDIKFWLDIK
jgi:hypothetical protein